MTGTTPPPPPLPPLTAAAARPPRTRRREAGAASQAAPAGLGRAPGTHMRRSFLPPRAPGGRGSAALASSRAAQHRKEIRRVRVSSTAFGGL
eukprot:320083-Chlamydomonas_euryale.AAC.7